MHLLAKETMFELIHPMISSGPLLITVFMILPLFLFFFLIVPTTKINFIKRKKPIISSNPSLQPSQFQLPKSYPVIGSALAFNRKNRLNFITEVLRSSPKSTFVLHLPVGGGRHVLTADPANVEHVLKTRFSIYEKGDFFKSILGDLLGNGIFNADGHDWRLQRQIASHEFSAKSLRKFVARVVDTELNERLIPLLSTAAETIKVLDLQDILRRFGFDNVCKIAFGYDPELLSISLPDSKFTSAFDEAVLISARRFKSLSSLIWRVKRAIGVGSEKRLKKAVREVRGFASDLVKKKKQEMFLANYIKDRQDEDSIIKDREEDLLSRFLRTGHLDEQFVTDIVISFILAGRDSTSAALTWFFWLLTKYPRVEQEILKEVETNTRGGSIDDDDDSSSQQQQQYSTYEEVKNLVYTHAALCEAMRLYPPVPADTKEAISDDVLPDGTVVKKGMTVTYYAYAMGRLEKLWGEDWAEFKPERWLQEVDDQLNKVQYTGDYHMKLKPRRFVPRDPYSYPVFQAGPRICLGKEMAFLQMKRVVVGVLKQFKVVPTRPDFEPIFIFNATAVMKGGFPVRLERRLR